MFIALNGKRILLYLCFFVFLCFTLFLFTGNKIFANNDNWGLSFSKEGEAPKGNADASFLRNYQAFFIGDTTSAKVYLTFDAGYEAGYTKTILETLKKHNVKAAFFVVGSYIRQNGDIVKQMVNDGHIVGNHSNTHPNMSKMATLEQFKQEITPVEEAYQTLIGAPMPKFYRPPQGIYNEKNLEMAKSLGYQTIFWSLAYVDWYKDNQPTKQEAFDKLLPRIHNGAIILLHSTSKTNCEILDEFITILKEKGYTFGTLDELNSSSTR